MKSTNFKNICFFSGDLNRAGGTERVGTTIANALAIRGYKVYFLSLENGEMPFFQIDSNICIASLHMEGKNKKYNIFGIIKNSRIFLQNNNIDYIVGIDVISSVFIIPAAYKLKTEVIAWEHFNYFAKVGNTLQNFERSLGRWLSCKFAKAVVTLTEEDRIAYIKNTKNTEKIIHIFNPVTIDKTDKSYLRKKNVLAVGRLMPQKGFDLLLKAWKIVKEKDSEWSLTIVGSGNEEEKLFALTDELNLSDSVKFIPNTRRIEQYYINASIFALSSRYEGFGLVLLEAKNFGLPVVSFSCKSGPTEIIKNNVDGFLVEEGNCQELAEKILVLVNDKGLRIRMGGEAFKENRFELNNIINKWEELFV